MPNLHGVDLQRAIAEAKGWTKIVNGRGRLVGSPPPYPDGEPLTPIPILDLAAAHALLDELVERGWGWVMRYNPLTATYKITGVSMNSRRDVVIEALAFCTAVGNLWLECRG